MKVKAVIVLAMLVGFAVLYGKSYFTKRSSLSQCRDWYKSSFIGWRDWETLPTNKKAELLRLNSNIDDVVAGACDCLYSKSKVFREQTLPKHGVDVTSSYIDLE